ncbi:MULTISPECIES: NAD(P)/FAD-dependent oxidoreductase [unclassified Streptomyces]|uniref:NAD(P)/FAD-dependent oxidoreductase n=1 Tax=unclassified Streptomyces TaxID=2593676 RepID=UPI0022B5F88B|nr:MULTISPECIES: FAD-dependent oxidoreductase [unclassified Streptomyces]MCZ7413925.1 FAD-dependent oxidoreductase [Streptomyces sp. WMMC897]MCZ7430921.1 FAD-dependent oxidoreductase [Streptomyces sp. WMMC1477]
MSGTLVVVGHGMVAHRLVAELRRRDPGRRWRIVVLGEENRPAYDRVALSSYLNGRREEELRLRDVPGEDGPALAVRQGVRVVGLDRGRRTVACSDGTEVRYDALVLATGSRSFVPPVPGHDLPGCFVHRTLDDLDAIRAAARTGRPGVVVGGGLLGLEAAGSLRGLGLSPHVVEFAPWPMPAQLDADGGALLAARLRSLGLAPHCEVTVREVTAGPDGRARAVVLSDGRVLETSVVVFAAGIRPRDELAEAAGLERGPRGGFRVDGHCRTADPRVWAVGECAALRGRCHGLVGPGYRMAESVAAQLTDEVPDPLPEPDLATRLKLLELEVASFGDAHGTTEGSLAFSVGNPGAGTYARLTLGPDGDTLLGGVLVGDTRAYALLHSLRGHPLPTAPDTLLRPAPS